MFETEQICPYTGLRSFTEEESLYFKGREEDIDQATEQLQRNKFLMLTGASGDGKSSLIYAGIIPNARAGFLKSKYSQWCVADFRPERSPFQNLCRSIARQLDIASSILLKPNSIMAFLPSSTCTKIQKDILTRLPCHGKLPMMPVKPPLKGRLPTSSS
ncbi:MAG: ATP-binding protein [Chitinophagaceae bacterium]|nr:ATP-binding protein [Chitinophagaceae bacterium]